MPLLLAALLASPLPGAATALTCRGGYAVDAVQTAVEGAAHEVQADGIPRLRIEGVGEVGHPAWIALYGLAYAGREQYDPALGLQPDPRRFDAVARWLEQHLEPVAGGAAWTYGFDSSYNDVQVRAPWISAFAQATGIQVFVEAYRRSGERRWLQLARRAAQPLLRPLDRGGLQFRAGDDIWFEEIPAPCDNPSHILNGHLRAAIALWELAEASDDRDIRRAARAATATAVRWMPRYDTGYWLRYDLNPRKRELLFRLANPYGGSTGGIAVAAIRLRDPVSGKAVEVQPGRAGDAEGDNRIAGIGWSQPLELDGRRVRRLLEGEQAAHAYVYLSLPAAWRDNLRDAPLELEVEYHDEVEASLALQMRSIAPGTEFRDLRHGDLLLAGDTRWRTWRIPLRPEDLGQPVGEFYAAKHATYLADLARREPALERWAAVAGGYRRAALPFDPETGRRVEAREPQLPRNTPVVPVLSIDDDGVVMQHFSDSRTRWNPDGSFDPSGGTGVPVYSPYLVAMQALDPAKLQEWHQLDALGREPAWRWLAEERNYRRAGDGIVYPYPFPNVYNDVTTAPSWASAFGQAYVLKALRQGRGSGQPLPDGFVDAVVAGFGVAVRDGGVRWRAPDGASFFEEVPNGTHVLNAHLVSTAELLEAARDGATAPAAPLAAAGVWALRQWLPLFDAGYWLRYDLNPKKQLLLQVATLQRGTSPLIDRVVLQNTRSGAWVELDVGTDADSEGPMRLSGADWTEAASEDGSSVRGFRDGRMERDEPVEGGALQNVFLVLPLPEWEFADAFDVPEHRLVVRYRDVGPGSYSIRVQSIRDGNHLEFHPLRGGLWTTVGDGQWKELHVALRPQDLGWYKGPDYQRFEVEQLQRVADLADDWLLRQAAERQSHYLGQQARGAWSHGLDASGPSRAVAPARLKVVDSSSVYPGFGFENSLDADPFDDYTAGVEGQAAYFVDLELEQPRVPGELRLVWEGRENYARAVEVSALQEDGSAELLQRAQVTGGGESLIPLRTRGEVKRIRIAFDDLAGQPRVLLRLIEVR